MNDSMKKKCGAENAPFLEMECDENYFYTTFKQGEEYLKNASEEEILGKKEVETGKTTPQKTPQKTLTDLETKVLKEIINNPNTSRREIAEILKLNQDTVKEYLDKLKKKKVIKRVGPDKGGYWEILTE